jgi:hypothetical protein
MFVILVTRPSLEETKEKYITESQNEIDEYADVIQKSTSHLEKHDSSIENGR